MTPTAFHRTVKLQLGKNSSPGSIKAKIGIPARIGREAALAPGMFIAWQELRGMLHGAPATTASLHASTIFAGGHDQLYCGVPGLFCTKYDLAPGTLFEWQLAAGQVTVSSNVRKRHKQEIRTRNTDLHKTIPVHLLPMPAEGRLRVTLPAEFVHLLNLQPGHFIRWDVTPEAIQAIPSRSEHLNTTHLVQRQHGLQVEIPKLLGDQYALSAGQTCTWTLQQGRLVGTIPLRT
jgi:hypothetical protein